MKQGKSRFDVLGQIGALRRYARSLTRNDADAEDLVQDTLVRAYEKRSSFRPDRNLRTWLMTILHNMFVDRIRSRQAETRRLDQAADASDGGIDPEQDHAVRLAQVRDAFLDLPEEQRAALHLVAIEGFSYAEAAVTLGVPIGTVMSRIARARTSLRAMEEGPEHHLRAPPLFALWEDPMTVPIDPITETDLHAYVDDQLEVQRRIEVEAFLSREPETAARVMADLRSRDELRLALADMPRIGRVGTMDAARRLERGISQDRWFTRVSRAAGLIACIGVGWVAHAQLGTLSIGTVNASTPAPRYVADARQAYEASQVRATLPSAAKSASYDREEIRAATAIALPELPAGWTVEDAQIFPSTFGPSVEVAIKADTLGSLALFAVRPGSFDVIPATVARDGQTAAYWQIGEVAYVLIADVESRKLEQVAVNLAKTLY